MTSAKVRILVDRQERVLKALADNGEMSARLISLCTGLPTPKVVGALRVLESRFEVQRDTIGQDRKGAIWSLSEMGRRRLA